MLGRCLGHFEVKVRVEAAIVLSKQLTGTNEFLQAPHESCPNIINCLLGVEEVKKHHGARSGLRFSLPRSLCLSLKRMRRLVKVISYVMFYSIFIEGGRKSKGQCAPRGGGEIEAPLITGRGWGSYKPELSSWLFVGPMPPPRGTH